MVAAMGDARRSFTAFRLTPEEQADIRKNDRDLVLEPETGVVEAKPTIEEAEKPETVLRPFQMPTQIID
jgi:hypothetical protein